LEIIEIDGSIGEGGGQVLRTAIALSALSMKPVRVYNIRAKRPNPGLRPQHMEGVRALAMLTRAKVEGLKLGSTTLTFHPTARASGRISINIGTAGSISLVLQAILPALAFSHGKTEVEITGGTDVKWSPPIDYLKHVFLPHLSRMGYHVEIHVLRRGHYPRGGGKVRVITEPVREIKPITAVELGEIVKVEGISHCVRLPRHVAERQASAAASFLKKAGFNNVSISVEWYRPEEDRHLGPGSGIVLWAKSSKGAIIGSDALGEPRKRAEDVGMEAARKLVTEISKRAPIDRHIGDMLPPYMAIAAGRSEILVTELTLHAETNIAIVEKILNVKFYVEKYQDGRARIKVNGLGLINSSYS